MPMGFRSADIIWFQCESAFPVAWVPTMTWPTARAWPPSLLCSATVTRSWMFCGGQGKSLYTNIGQFGEAYTDTGQFWEAYTKIGQFGEAYTKIGQFGEAYTKIGQYGRGLQ